MKKLALIVLAGCMALSGFSQTQPSAPTKKDKKEARRERINALVRMEEEGELVFRKHSIFGFKATTDGYGLSYELGRFKSNRVTTTYFVELNEKKHRQEKKLSTINGFEFNSVILYKLNNFYQFKVGMGQQRIIGGKGNKNGVAVAAVYGGGLSLGLLKPYLIDVDAGGKRIRSRYPTVSDSGYQIIGAAGFLSGWNDLSLKPGVHAKAGMRFDFGRFNETVTALEVGVTAEYYTGKIPQMFLTEQKQ
ncbi:MAG TPA: hypothetical protein VD996_13355, partial [Chitinophagaceae bacterium]|nr:hypothetical protein [Chitinophagaceae bacterium]